MARMATINLPRIIRVGGGALAELPGAMAQCGVARPFIVTDGFMVSSGMVASLLAVLDGAGIGAVVFSETVPDPTVAVVETALEALRAADCDCVVGFGGGSPIDTAKAIAALAVEPRPVQSMKAPATTDVPGLPIIAVPTTAGTGSEATKFTM